MENLRNNIEGTSPLNRYRSRTLKVLGYEVPERYVARLPIKGPSQIYSVKVGGADPQKNVKYSTNSLNANVTEHPVHEESWQQSTPSTSFDRSSSGIWGHHFEPDVIISSPEIDETLKRKKSSDEYRQIDDNKSSSYQRGTNKYHLGYF